MNGSIAQRRLVLGIALSLASMTGGTAATASPVLQKPVESDTRVQYRFISVDGINIFYREAGDPRNPTMLLLHGFSSSSHMFRDLMPLLADRYHLIAPDYPGFGYSDAPPADVFEPTFANLETVMSKFVTQRGLSSFVVYVQDFGGPVGFRMATKHPEWIRGLVVQNANAYREGLSPEQVPRDPATPMSARVVTPEFIAYMYRTGARNPNGLNPDAWTVDIAALQKVDARRIQMALIDDYPSNIALYDEWQRYLRKAQPTTLIVWGRNDRGFTTDGAEAFKRDVHDARVVYFDTGHFALEEDALGIAREIEATFAGKQ